MHIFVQYSPDAVGEQLSPATQELEKWPPNIYLTANAVVLATGIRKTSGSRCTW
jgi:hypothetical protein